VPGFARYCSQTTTETVDPEEIIMAPQAPDLRREVAAGGFEPPTYGL
jgi:hypothetical protein